MSLLDDPAIGLLPSSRRPEAVITGESAPTFEAAAAAVRPDLMRQLQARGVSRADADDAVQDTLLRAWERAVPFTDTNDLMRWCLVVARRVHIDALRRRAKFAPMVDELCTRAQADLEAVELRQVLTAVQQNLPALTPVERTALLGTPAGSDRSSQVRNAVARHRARRRLRGLVGPLAGLALGSWRLARRTAPATAVVGVALVVGLPQGSGAAHVRVPPVAQPPLRPSVRTMPEPEPATAWRDPLVASPAHERTAAAPIREIRSAKPSRIAHVAAPGRTDATVSARPQRPEDHIVCVEGTLALKVCIA